MSRQQEGEAVVHCASLHAFYRIEERPAGAAGKKPKALSTTVKWGRYHRGPLKCSRVALPGFLSVYNATPNAKVTVMEALSPAAHLACVSPTNCATRCNQ